MRPSLRRRSDEEQARGITMKSSAIALIHEDEPYRELRSKYRLVRERRRCAR